MFFAVLFEVGIWHPLFLAMTATMTLDLLPSFSKLTCVDWSLPEHQLWSDRYDFQQRYIDLGFEVIDYMGRAYPTLFDHLKENPDASAFIFVNFRSECETVSKSIDEIIIAARLPFHHLVVHGHQDKHEKFGYISLFNGSLSMPNFLAQILISTAAANTGIDKDTIEMVLRQGVPRDVITLFQERGRNARQPGMSGAYYIYTNWSWFVSLLLSLLAPLQSDTDNNPTEDANSANVTFSPTATARRTARQSHTTTQRSSLTSSAIHNNVEKAFTDVVQVLNLNCLPALGCVHSRTEWFMKRGVLELPPPVIEPCHTKCHVCNGKYIKTFLPVIYSGASKFLKSTRIASTLPFILTHNNGSHLINTLWEDKDLCKDVFGVKHPNKGNVIGFFFQLIATNIISFELVNTNALQCVLTKQPNGGYVHEDTISWLGIEFRTPKRGNARVCLFDIIAAEEKAKEILQEY